MRVAEFFAGHRSVGRIAEERGHEVFSVDIDPSFPDIDLVADMEQVKPSDLPWVPDMIWASPLCTTYSLAAISHHRNEHDLSPKTELAANSDRVVQNTLALIRAFPTAIWYMENPNATLQYMPFMHGLHRVTVWYCRYLDIAAKPTNIFSNNIADLLNPGGWVPRPPCYNGNPHCHHERASRGSPTGTQGKKDSKERSRIPALLCREVIAATERVVQEREVVNTVV